MNYNELPTAVLIDSLPQNRPLYKDSGLWTIYDDDFETPILEQTASEDFRQFLIRYYEFISEFEDMEDVHIDLACSNLL
jgi:hypothetical protein